MHRKQVLLPDEIRQRLPKLYAQEKKGNNAIAYVKFFTPWTNWTWWATEFDPVEGRFFGLVEGFERELGYFMLSELEETKGPLGLSIERDEHFTPTKLCDLH